MLAAGLLASGCGGSDSTSSAAPVTSTPPVQLVTPAAPTSTFPFRYDGDGQGTSPPFAVAAAGTFTVTYHLVASAAEAPCTPSVALTAGSGSRTVTGGMALQAGQTRDGTITVELTTGDWRFVEGGGCAWSVVLTKG